MPSGCQRTKSTPLFKPLFSGNAAGTGRCVNEKQRPGQCTNHRRDAVQNSNPFASVRIFTTVNEYKKGSSRHEPWRMVFLLFLFIIRISRLNKHSVLNNKIIFANL